MTHARVVSFGPEYEELYQSQYFVNPTVLNQGINKAPSLKNQDHLHHQRYASGETFVRYPKTKLHRDVREETSEDLRSKKNIGSIEELCLSDLKSFFDNGCQVLNKSQRNYSHVDRNHVCDSLNQSKRFYSLTIQF
jgi:hypothetical protein